jgi:hypothetical protein
MHLELQRRNQCFPNFALHPFPNSHTNYFITGEETELCIRVKSYYNIVTIKFSIGPYFKAIVASNG